MFNSILTTRFSRFYNKDFSVPAVCFSKWWYVDIYEKCDCINHCKFQKFDKLRWQKYAKESYENLHSKHLSELQKVSSSGKH